MRGNPRILPPDIARRIFQYDPASGVLSWRERAEGFGSEALMAAWNRRFANRPAGAVNHAGYLQVRYADRDYLVHRVIWSMEYGCEPKHQLDHIDGDSTNNRLENLRDVPHFENCRNASLRSDNTSGTTGISWSKRWKRWVVRLHILGKAKTIGSFREFDDAVIARDAAYTQNGFHPNHGRRENLRLTATS